MNDEIIHVPVPRSMFTAVCALLGGVAASAVAVSAHKASTAPAPAAAEPDKVPAASPASTAPAASTGAPANADGVTHDAAGVPFDPARHTGSIVKSGLWRLKAGLSRGPGEDVIKDTTGTSASATGTNAGSTAPAPSAAPATDADDEFAAFRAAASETAPVAAVARKWSDADLSKLCNQAAVKLNDPVPVKEIIAQFVPAGEVQHSRAIPDDKREDFAKAIEAKAGITFEG